MFLPKNPFAPGAVIYLIFLNCGMQFTLAQKQMFLGRTIFVELSLASLAGNSKRF